jgi:hypothetical protein
VETDDERNWSHHVAGGGGVMTWWRRKRSEEDLDRELNDHLELEAEEQREAGLPVEQSQFAAHRNFGNITYTKEEVRRMWVGRVWKR